MKNKIVSVFIILFSAVFSGCDRSVETREIEFIDYVHVKNSNEKITENKIDVLEGTRTKGFLIRNIPNNLQDLENYIKKYTDELLFEEFVKDSERKILESNGSVVKKYIEIDFFRVSDELPWVTDENYVPPYHIGEGNPKDWVGSVLFNIDKNEIDCYWVAKRKKGIVDYGKILEEKEYSSTEPRP